MASSNEGRKVCHRGAGDQPSFATGRQAKGIANPLKHYILKLRGDRRHHPQRGVLIPSDRYPARGECGGNHPAVHEAKITAARHRRRGRGTYRIQLVEDIGGLARSLGKRLMKFGKSRESSRGWTYTSFSDIIDVANRFFSGKVQQLTDL